MEPELKRIIRVVGDLPSIPTLVGRVMHVAHDANSSADDLRQILEQDPALSARILKVANSSIYSFAREVETLKHAITLLGFRTVENLVMAASLRDVFQHFGLTEKLLWEHATIAGSVASKLSSYGPIDVEREAAFTAGLLHDLGKIALANTMRERYNKVVMHVYNDGVSFLEAEREQFGFDHAEVGSHVADKWRLPHRLISAIRYHHHDPVDYAGRPEDERRLIALTTVVTLCCTCIGVGRRGPVEAIRVTESAAWEVLGLTEDDEERVLGLVSEEAKRADGLFV